MIAMSTFADEDMMRDLFKRQILTVLVVLILA